MRPPWRFVVLILLLAFAFRLVVAWKTGLFHVLVRTEEEHIALSVVGTGQYGNPYALYTGETAHETPIYPLFLAALFALFGTGTGTEIVRVVITSALSALRCALLPWFALDAGLGSITAVLAGILSVFYIPALETEMKGSTDGAWAAMVLLAIVWVSLRVWRTKSWQSRTPWWFFALCGFAVLLDPVILPVIAAFLIAGAIACSSGFRKRYLGQILLLSFTVFLFLLPWAIRNRIALNKLIWTKSNFGLEFWVSNGPGRAFDLGTNMGDPNLHPSNSLEEAQQVATLGEVKYNQQKLAETLSWIRDDPGDFLQLTVHRFVAWWFPPGPNLIIQAAKLGLSLLAFVGLLIVFRGQPLTGWLILLTWITLPDIYYVIQWSSRYRFPMEWQLLICASAALATAYAAVHNFLNKKTD